MNRKLSKRILSALLAACLLAMLLPAASAFSAQSSFAVSGVWTADTDENGACFRMSAQGAGWVEYLTGLDAQALDFTYDITPTAYAGNAAGSVLRLRSSQNPEVYFFARIFLSAAGQYLIAGQLYNSAAQQNWTNVITMNSWVGGVTDNALRVRVYTENGSLKLAVSNPNGSTLGTYTAQGMPADFMSCEALQLLFGCESGNGTHTLSRFCGLPAPFEPDKRATPFGRVAFAFADTDYNLTAWQNELCADICAYQNTAVSTAVCTADKASMLAADADLLVLPGWVFDGASAENNAAALSQLLTELKAESPSDTVFAVCGLPYGAMASYERLAAYNANIRSTAQTQNVLYVNLYNAMRSTPWSVDADGVTPSAIGNTLISGAILKELLRSCTCLAVNATAAIQITASAPVQKTAAALNTFRAATDTATLKTAVEDAHLGLDLDIYHSMTTAQQRELLTLLLAEHRAAVSTHTAADALFNRVCMQLADTETRALEGVKFRTYVAVGDSISVGETSVNKATDGWVPHLASLISAAQGEQVTLYKNAVSGTRMCTRTDNNLFPPAVETVQSYIAPYNPDLLTIAYGINDYHAHTTLETFISTYRIYLTEVVAACPDATVIVCGLCAKGGDADSAAMQTWNRAIKELAEEFDLIYCETYYDMRGIEWLLTDGLHPTNAGYRVMANAVYRTLCGKVNLGETVTVQPAAITSAYLTLHESIDVTYAVEVPEGCTDASMTFTMNGRTETVTDYTVQNGRRLYTFTGVTPQHMTDNITAVFRAVKGGTAVTAAVAEYSIRQYCINQLERYPDNTALVTLLSDLLTYGAAAQTYTGYHTEALATAGLTLTPRTFTGIPARAISFAGGRSTAADWESATLQLKNAITVRLFFAAADTDGLTVTVSHNGTAATYTAADFISNGAGRYCVELAGISASAFDEAVTALFAQNGVPVGRTLSYSVNAYLCAMQNTENANLQTLVRALYNYGVSAAAYASRN